MRCDDAALAARWESLRELPDGRSAAGVAKFYDARGFAFPGRPGSAPPLLAQHDWVHVLADYGSTVESEIEVFAFIARANDDPRAFSLLAMVISLFETGYLATRRRACSSTTAAISRTKAWRCGSPTRCGAARCVGAHAARPRPPGGSTGSSTRDRPVDDVRAEFGVVAKSERAIEAGSVGPWEPGGISPYQYECGQCGRRGRRPTLRLVRSRAAKRRRSLLGMPETRRPAGRRRPRIRWPSGSSSSRS